MNDKILHVTELFALDDLSFINNSYNLLLRREPDNAGRRYYIGRLALGYGRGSIIYDLTKSKEYNQKNTLIGLEQLILQEKMRRNWLFRFFMPKLRNGNNTTVSLGSCEKSIMFPVVQLDRKDEQVEQDNNGTNVASSLEIIESQLLVDGSKDQYCEALMSDNVMISTQYRCDHNINEKMNINVSKKTLKIDDTMVYGRPRFNKIIAIKLDHMGDLILFHPALTKLRNRYPNSQIDALVGSWNKQQLQSWGIVDNIITYDFFKPVSAHSSQLNYKDLVISLSKMDEYDLAIDFRRDDDTRFILANVTSSFTIGYKSHNADIDNEMSICLDYNLLQPGVRVPENYTHMSYQLVKLVDSIPYNHTDYIDIKCNDITGENDSVVGIFPYCGTSFRDWPTKNYKKIIDNLLANNIDVVINIYIVSKDDIFCDLCNCDARVNVMVGLGYNELMHSLSTCKVVLSNNSYGGHLAGLLGVPSVIIFSGTELPHEWRPTYGRNIVIYHDIECSPCHANNVLQCPYNIACMDISVSDVYEQICNIIESKQLVNSNDGVWTLFKNELFSRLSDKSKIGIDKLRELHIAYANNHKYYGFSFDFVIGLLASEALHGDDSSISDFNELKILHITIKPDGNCLEARSGRHVSHANIENSVVFVVIKNETNISDYKNFIRAASEHNCTVVAIIENDIGRKIKSNSKMLSDIGSSLAFSSHVICADNDIELLSQVIEHGVQNADDICSVNLQSRSMVGRNITEVIGTFYRNTNNSNGYINIRAENGKKTFFWFDHNIHVGTGSRVSEDKVIALGRGRDNSIYGPYIKLSAGVYIVDVLAVISPVCRNLLVRCCSMETEEFFAEEFIDNPHEGVVKLRIPFCIDNDVDKVEVLFSANEGSVFSVVNYTITKNDPDMISPTPTRKVYSLLGACDSNLTEVGMVTDNHEISTTNKRVALVYGQNITLKPGRYAVNIYGNIAHLTGDELILVTSEKGAVKITEPTSIKANDGVFCNIIEFELPSKYEGVEICVYVDSATKLFISRISICEY